MVSRGEFWRRIHSSGKGKQSVGPGGSAVRSRREFFQLAMAAASVPFVYSGPTKNSNRLITSVYDVRYPDSIVFGQESQRLGSTINGIQDDVVPVLDAGLSQLLQRDTVLVAGLTRFAAFYHLERLANANNGRVLYHAEHLYHGNGHMEHKLTAPVWALKDARYTLLAGEHWACSIANIVTGIDGGHTQLATVTVETRALNASSGIGHLESWVIG
jgi:hypothetical protein